MSFFTFEKTYMSNQLASQALRDYFYLDAFWRVNLGMCIIKKKKENVLTLLGFCCPFDLFYRFFNDL